MERRHWVPGVLPRVFPFQAAVLVISLWLVACHRHILEMVAAMPSPLWSVPMVFVHVTMAYFAILVSVLSAIVGGAIWKEVRSVRRLGAVRVHPPEALLAVAVDLVPPDRLYVLADMQPYLFCAGLWQPNIYVSAGFLVDARADELSAALAHEEAHRRRRDPLRLLLAALFTHVLRPLPWGSALRERIHLRAEVAADQFARDHAPMPALARSLLRVLQHVGPAQPQLARARGGLGREDEGAVAHLVHAGTHETLQAYFGERLHYLTLPKTAQLPSLLPQGLSHRDLLRMGLRVYYPQVIWVLFALLFVGGAFVGHIEALHDSILCVFGL